MKHLKTKMLSLILIVMSSVAAADPVVTATATFNVRAVVSGQISITNAAGGPLQDMEMTYIAGSGLQASIQNVIIGSNKAGADFKFSLSSGAHLNEPGAGTSVPLDVLIAGTKLSSTPTLITSITVVDGISNSVELVVKPTTPTTTLPAGTYTGIVNLTISQPA